MPPWQFIEAVQGSNGANASVATSTITKSGGGSAWDAGAATNQTFSGDCFVEVTVTSIVTTRWFGLSLDVGLDNTTIDYAIRYDVADYSVYENGVLKQAATGLVAGDTLRIERIGTTVRFFRNGEMYYSSSTPSSGALRFTVNIFNVGAELSSVRVYDGVSKTWPALTWATTNETVSAGTTLITRRMTFAAPTKLQAGDQLIVVLASQGGEFVSAASSTWGFVDIISSTNRRGFAIYRRIATSSEPASYTFDLNVKQETLGMMLVYRSLDLTAAIVGGSASDVASATTWSCPSRTLTRYSDLYFGLVLQVSAIGSLTVPTDSTYRLDFTQSVFGFVTPKLLAFDFSAEAIGATDTKRVTASVASSGAVASIAVSGLPAPGAGLSWLPPTPGAIGLPSEGI